MHNNSNSWQRNLLLTVNHCAVFCCSFLITKRRVARHSPGSNFVSDMPLIECSFIPTAHDRRSTSGWADTYVSGPMAVGLLQSLAQRSGTVSQISSGTRQSALTLSDVYWRRICLRDTSAHSALEVDNFALYKSTYLLTYLLTSHQHQHCSRPRDTHGRPRGLLQSPAGRSDSLIARQWSCHAGP